MIQSKLGVTSIISPENLKREKRKLKNTVLMRAFFFFFKEVNIKVRVRVRFGVSFRV